MFDLLNIQLLHGWLVEPQDELTAAAIGQKSYNEIVMALVLALGSAATPTRQLTPSSSLRSTAAGGAGGSSSLSPPAPPPPVVAAADQALPTAAAASEGSGAGAGAGAALTAIDAGTLAAALQNSLRISTQERRPSVDLSARSSVPTSATSQASESTFSHINHMASLHQAACAVTVARLLL